MTVTQLDVFTQPKPSSPEAKWARWIARPTSWPVVAEIERRALACWQNGDRRVEINRIVADVRRDLGVSVDNSLRAILARRLVEKHPQLDALIERRRRRSA